MNKNGILIISHGSRDEAWVRDVDMTIEEAKTALYHELSQTLSIAIEQVIQKFPIISSFLELVEGRLIQDGINMLQNKGVTHIHVLPLFVSAGSTHLEEIKQAFGYKPSHDFIGDLEPLLYDGELTFDTPLIDDRELVSIISRQLLTFNINEAAVLIIGHGSTVDTYYQLWSTGMEQLIGKLNGITPNIPFYYAALLPDNTKYTMLQITEQYEHIAVIPLFLSQGYFTRRVIPNRLAGFTYHYHGETLLPSNEMVQLLVRRYKTLFKL